MQNKIIIIIGKKGSGKSHLANLLMLEKSVDKKVLIYDTLNEYDYPIADLDKFPTLKKGIFRVTPIECQDDKEFFGSICEYVYKIQNTVLLVDEIDMYCSATSHVEYLTKICRYGRHKQVDLIAITRRPSDVPRSITAMADEFYVFKIQEPKDISYLKNIDFQIKEKIDKLVRNKVQGYTTHVKIIP
jgi:DNA helicase HerA-like ATPase